jgi:hypothetical protein
MCPTDEVIAHLLMMRGFRGKVLGECKATSGGPSRRRNWSAATEISCRLTKKPDDVENAIAEMKQAGIIVVQSANILEQSAHG